ncbi:MAG: hypothetical protein IID53_16525 [Proteobacteria bacterium]|nr:hypothetical protein [Pseudomonadota bacterium]MCH8098662.1 hypothetical protein [Pseudomonadota bacterium]
MSIKEWEVVIKGVGAVAAIGTVLYGLLVYLDQRGNQITNRRLEIDQKVLENQALVRKSKMIFLKKQFELYIEAVSVVSRLANTNHYENRKDDLQRYWQLYWGDLGMVEDPKVEQAMIAVGKILMTEDKSPLADKMSRLKNASLDLSHCVSKSLEASWGVQFPTRRCKYE